MWLYGVLKISMSPQNIVFDSPAPFQRTPLEKFHKKDFCEGAANLTSAEKSLGLHV